MSVPSRPPAGSGGGARSLAWLRRHPIWSVGMAALAVIAIIAAATSTPPAKARPSGNPAAAVPAVTLAPTASPLVCSIRLSSKRPRDHSTVTITVRTVAHARVRIVTALALAAGQSAVGRAGAHGAWVRQLQIGNPEPGVRVLIAVRVARSPATGACQASLRPRPRAAPAPVTPKPTPTATATMAPPPPPPAPAGCYPKTDGGNCYEPGEFCRDDDHGTTGVAGDGEKIICEDNDGWRWEPY
jgi:hypothetical protein